MIPFLIGIATAIVTILFVELMRFANKRIMYGLILSGIGFLYVGYTWTDFKQLVIVDFIIGAYIWIFKNRPAYNI